MAKKDNYNQCKKVELKGNNPSNSNIVCFGGLRISNTLLIIVALFAVLAIALFWFINSSFWPWPSAKEVSYRFNEILDTCINNERSRDCSLAQDKYHMTFEYCHSLADIPEIDKKIPIYGVVKKDNIQTIDISYRGGDKAYNKYPYYGCTAYFENIDRDIDTDLLSAEPSTMALFALYKTPQYVASGNSTKCTISIVPGFNFLWDQIPNMAGLKSEFDTVLNSYKQCSQLPELQNSLKPLNTRLSSYSNNRAVQQFYKNYDDWTTPESDGKVCQSVDDMKNGCAIPQTCSFMDRSFKSTICGATTGTNPSNDLSSFSSEMRSYTTTEEFTSKIITKY